MTCPCCEAHAFTYHTILDRFAWQRCESCGFLIGDVTRRVGPDAGYDRLDMAAYDRSVGRLRAAEASRLIELVNRANPTQRSWIDIGCGVGLLMSAAREQGYTTWGVEPDPLARERAESTNPSSAVGSDLSQLPQNIENAGVVSMLDVLEHIPADELTNTARSVRERLASDGIWLIKVPSSDGPFYRATHLVARLLPKQTWPFIERLWLLRFASPHCVYFNEKSAKSFLSAHGFEPVGAVYFPAIPLSSAFARLSMDRTISRWRAAVSLPIVAILNICEAVFRRSDSLVLLARRREAD